MSDKIAIGKQIKAVREMLCLTQQSFADHFNSKCPANLATTRADIARYETGRNSVPAEKYVVFMSLTETNKLNWPKTI